MSINSSKEGGALDAFEAVAFKALYEDSKNRCKKPMTLKALNFFLDNN